MAQCFYHGCKSEFTPKTSRARFCSRSCMVTFSVWKRRIKLKHLAIEYKGGACERCGYNACVDALEFHHLDPNEKDFGIAAKGYTRSWDATKVELDKCIMLCSNCHREEHYQQKDTLYIIDELLKEWRERPDLNRRPTT